MKVDNSNLITMCVSKDTYPIHDKKEIILLGRSNVGKSTFINKFTNRKKLAYTSSTPGKTQTLNFYDINDDICFVDVPGYGYAKVSKKDREKFGLMIEEYLTTRPNIIFATLLIDFKVGPTEDDILMYEFLKHNDIYVCVLCTKKDKVPKTKRNKQLKFIMDKLQYDINDHLIVYSSEDKNDIINVHNDFEDLLYD
ncbi:MAG: ribosome biogenesis GTP-binding protein YihA/YsxC [Mycoplasmatales bacterium]